MRGRARSGQARLRMVVRDAVPVTARSPSPFQSIREVPAYGLPKCRRDHRLKQDPRWKVDQLPDGTFRWNTPSGRQYSTEPTRYLS